MEPQAGESNRVKSPSSLRVSHLEEPVPGGTVTRPGGSVLEGSGSLQSQIDALEAKLSNNLMHVSQQMGSQMGSQLGHSERISGLQAYELRAAVNEDHITTLAKRVGKNSSVIDSLNQEAAAQIAALRQHLNTFADRTASVESLRALQARVQQQDEKIGQMRSEIDRLATIIAETLRTTRERKEGRDGWEDGRTIAIQQLESRMRRLEDQLSKVSVHQQHAETHRRGYEERQYERVERKTDILQDEVRKLREQLQHALSLFINSKKQVT